jgi:hypothetical protein
VGIRSFFTLSSALFRHYGQQWDCSFWACNRHLIWGLLNGVLLVDPRFTIMFYLIVEIIFE